ncbi:hypothetical protein ACFL54_02600 [Planctomycetota bacterium]
MNFIKKTLPLLIAFLLGMIGIFINLSPHSFSEKLQNELALWLRLIGAWAVFMGTYSLLMLHRMRIKRKVPGWGYSILIYIGFLAMLSFGFYNCGNWFWGDRVNDGGVPWLYSYVYQPCQATMFSILAFFIASAAYRTFRAKTLDSAFLLLAAVIMMFGQIPLAQMLATKTALNGHEWLAFNTVGDWLMDYPNVAVKRGILFGVCLGVIGTSLRIIFGIERAYLGGD